MYRRILVTIDFSEPSVAALKWAVRRFPDAEVTLFHAIEAVKPPSYVQQTLGGDTSFELERELDVRANLEHLADECGIEPRISVHTGWPPRQIHLAAEEEDCEIIVVGAHTRRIWPLNAPGIMSNKIANKASRPVLVWRSAATQMGARDRAVLAAVDLREGSEPVAKAAVRLARHFEARLVLLHVLSPTLQGYLRAVSTPAKVQEVFQQVEQSAREEVARQLSEGSTDIPEAQTVVLRGRPVTQILVLAENESVDLIVIGQRQSPTGAGRVLLGRVTEIVLREANCSVLVVPV